MCQGHTPALLVSSFVSLSHSESDRIEMLLLESILATYRRRWCSAVTVDSTLAHHSTGSFVLAENAQSADVTSSCEDSLR